MLLPSGEGEGSNCSWQAAALHAFGVQGGSKPKNPHNERRKGFRLWRRGFPACLVGSPTVARGVGNPHPSEVNYHER